MEKSSHPSRLLEERVASARSYTSLEDIPVWRDARQLVQSVYELTKQAAFVRDRSFCDQIRRAALSVMNNIAEGYERGSEVELARYLYIAKGSCGEVRSMLYAAQDLKMTTPDATTEIYSLCLSGSRQLAGFIRHLEAKRAKTSRAHG